MHIIFVPGCLAVDPSGESWGNVLFAIVGAYPSQHENTSLQASGAVCVRGMNGYSSADAHEHQINEAFWIAVVVVMFAVRRAMAVCLAGFSVATLNPTHLPALLSQASFEIQHLRCLVILEHWAGIVHVPFLSLVLNIDRCRCKRVWLACVDQKNPVSGELFKECPPMPPPMPAPGPLSPSKRLKGNQRHECAIDPV